MFFEKSPHTFSESSRLVYRYGLHKVCDCYCREFCASVKEDPSTVSFVLKGVHRLHDSKGPVLLFSLIFLSVHATTRFHVKLQRDPLPSGLCFGGSPGNSGSGRGARMTPSNKHRDGLGS